MTNILSIITKIKNTDSTNEKQKILESHKDSKTLNRVFLLTYDNSINFGISVVKDAIPVNGGDGSVTLDEAMDFLELRLATRALTGNAARNYLAELYTHMTSDDIDVLNRILSRDLDCGASSTIANKVWPNLILKQPQALCNSFNEKNIQHIVYPAYAQLKADGARCFSECVINEDGSIVVTHTTRARNKIYGIDHITDEIKRLIKDLGITKSFKLDGELTYYENGESTVKTRQYGNGLVNSAIQGGITPEEAAGFVYDVWDMIPLDEVLANKGTEPYHERYDNVQTFCGGSLLVVPIENFIVNNIEEATAIFRNYLKQGLEGIILKNISMLWKDGRLKDQVKFKEVLTGDLKVVGYKLHSKDKTKIGSLSLVSSCGNVEVSVGSGFKDTTRRRNKDTKEWEQIPMSERPEDDREKMLENWDSIKGSIVEVQYNSLIQADGSELYSLYLPVFKGFRHDKTEANSYDELNSVTV